MDRVARRGSLARAPDALKSHNAEKLKGGTLWGFSTSILSQNIKKLKKTKIVIFGKKSHNAEKNWKGGPFGLFQHPFCRKTSKKMQGGPFGEKFFFEKKSLAVPKQNERGESLVSPGMVCYAEKQEKPFWFSSLDQIVHFDAIIFCRTFVELFWSVRVDRKKSHYNSRVSLHEAPTKKDWILQHMVNFAKYWFFIQANFSKSRFLYKPISRNTNFIYKPISQNPGRTWK